MIWELTPDFSGIKETRVPKTKCSWHQFPFWLFCSVLPLPVVSAGFGFSTWPALRLAEGFVQGESLIWNFWWIIPLLWNEWFFHKWPFYVHEHD